MTLKEIHEKRATMDAEYATMPEIPTVPLGNGVQVTCTAQFPQIQARINGTWGFVTDVMEYRNIDAFVREWLKLRPEALQEQETRP